MLRKTGSVLATILLFAGCSDGPPAPVADTPVAPAVPAAPEADGSAPVVAEPAAAEPVDGAVAAASEADASDADAAVASTVMKSGEVSAASSTPEGDPSEPAGADAKPMADAVAETKPEEPAEPAEPEHPYLPLPEGYESRMASLYTRFATTASVEEPPSLLMLARISDRIGSELVDSDRASANAFLKQSAAVAREAIHAEGSELPAVYATSFIYNEACAYANEGELEQAQASLVEAVEAGYDNFEHLMSDPDLAALRESESFAKQVETWQSAAAERHRIAAKADLAEGETYSFELALTDIKGTEHTIEAYRGQVLIVDIWGTWCPPCRAEIPSFVKLQNNYGDDGLQILGVNYERADTEEEKIEKVVDFTSREGVNYPCMLGEDETKGQVPGFRGYPTTLFIDRSGKVRMTAVGAHDYAYLEAVVSELLAEEYDADAATAGDEPIEAPSEKMKETVQPALKPAAEDAATTEEAKESETPSETAETTAAGE